MTRYVMLAGMMIAFQHFAGTEGGAYLLSSVIGVWACGVAIYEVRAGNAPLLFPRRKKSPRHRSHGEEPMTGRTH